MSEKARIKLFNEFLFVEERKAKLFENLLKKTISELFGK